ncbi:MAG: helix-turn-helix domain-containing protein [Loktanella sp.]|nr:helix-turn-helix domain-containing protein [Loktanella sp.]
MLDNLLTETEFAEARGVHVRTIQRERARREGPPFIKLGRRIFYRREAIEAWLLAQEQAQPRAAGGAR